MSVPCDSVSIEFKQKNDLERLDEMKAAYEREMSSYIEKYILDGRTLDEIFAVAHIGALTDIDENRCVYGHYVLEHIIECEGYYSDKSEIYELYEWMVKEGHITPQTRH